MNIISLFGFIIVTVMALPYVLYALRFREHANLTSNRVMGALEKYGCLVTVLLMIFPLGMEKFAFSHVYMFLVYLCGSIGLLVVYLITWIFYFFKKTAVRAVMLAAIPALIYLICGVALNHWLLVISSILFGIGHIYAAIENNP